MSSVNHYSRDVNHTNTLWWQHDHHHRENDAVPPLPAPETVWSKNDSSSCSDHQLETLFEKSLTPSDVGKLNRLVIPKQHAEKYFPLNGSSSAVLVGGSGGDAAEKGMLLSFEDETGKCWMFRYSYWNSSQSYVLTKGWSRYVREKQLDAGDVVFFQRHRSDARRLSIGWRRRGGGGDGGLVNTTPFSSGVATSTTPYRQLHHQIHGSTYPHYEDAAATVAEAQLPATTAMGPNSRTVRLFGVNLECQLDNDDDVAEAEPPCHDGYGLGSSSHFYYYPHPMNISFSGDTMKHMRDRRG